MDRDEWYLNHQGIAFTDDGKVARRPASPGCRGNVRDQPEVWVFTGLSRDALETIDQAFRRTAGDAMQMHGVANGRLVAAVTEALMKYEHRLIHAQTLSRRSTKSRSGPRSTRRSLTPASRSQRRSASWWPRPPLALPRMRPWRLAFCTAAMRTCSCGTFLVGVNSGVISNDYPNAPTSSLNKTFNKAVV